MKLAVSFSEILMAELLRNPQLPIRYLKVPTTSFPEGFHQIEAGKLYRDLLPHIAQPGVLSLGHPSPPQRLNPALIRKVMEETHPAYLSTHLHAKAAFFPEYEAKIHSNDPELKIALAERLTETIRLFQAQIKIPLVLENYPYYAWPMGENFRMGAQPEFIGDLCRRGGCGFLLDIAHARITAFYLGMAVMDYIEALPLDQCQEIHISGIQYQPGVGYWDSHSELTAEDWDLLEKVLEKTRPEIITLEYGGFADQVWNPFSQTMQRCPRNEPEQLLEMIGRMNEIR